MEKVILRGFFVLGLGLLPAVIFRKPAKDRMIIFLLTGFISNLLDEFLVNSNRVAYPLRIFKRFTDKSILFDYLIFPICCTLFIQVTSQPKPSVILLRSILFSLPMTLFEWLLERKTHLIKWMQWSPVHSFFSISLYLLATRGLIGVINKLVGLELLGEEEK